MAEILTESFCERCGTRYTFESPKPRRLGVGQIRTLTRGVRNFVANDSSSFADAMAAARDDESRVASQRQLDAFRDTFNFCMGCRQYTCRNCWNERASECLSCAPDLTPNVHPDAIQEPAAVGTREPAHGNGAEPAWPTADIRPSDTVITSSAGLLAPMGAPEMVAAAAALEPALTAIAPAIAPEPMAIAPEPAPEPMEIASAIAPEPMAIAPEILPEIAPEILPEIAPEILPEIAPEPMAIAPEPAEVVAPVPEAAKPAAAAAATPSEIELTSAELDAVTRALTRHVLAPAEARSVASAPETGAASGPAQAATTSPLPAEPVANARAATRSLLRRFRPRSERAIRTTSPPASASVAARPAFEEIAAAAAAPAAIPAAPADLAPAAAADLLRSAPGEAAAPPPEPATADTPAEAEPVSPPADHVAQPIWRIVAPESGSPAEPPPPPGRWIAPPPSGRRSADAMPSATWAARVATARPLESPVWAASSNDIVAAGSSGAARPVSIQACVTCGLSLSANARFCRRCGSRQG